ncbi:hypothetical protein IKP85_05980 [bacterium]|nr:hypothetical protein [bacterium]
MAASIGEKPTDEEVLEAIDVLRRAGLNISVSPMPSKLPLRESSADSNKENTASVRQANPAEYINQDYQTINMMLGNGNNNNNDPMMNMLPYMLQQNSDGKNLDPQVIQALMMNSMMNGISGLNSTDNK